MLRFLANALVGLFLLDAVVALLDATLGGLGLLRGALAALLTLLALAVHTLVATTPRLPGALLYPLTLFQSMALVVWVGLVGMDVASPTADLAVAVAQIGVGLAVLGAAWRAGNLPIVPRDVPFFTWRHTLVATALNLVVFPTVLLVGAGVAAEATLAHQSRGFLTLGLDGVESVDRVYRRGAEEVRVIGLGRPGDSAFYAALGPSLAPGTVLLQEEVTDRANVLGRHATEPLLTEALGAEAAGIRSAAIRARPGVQVQRVDLDLSDLSAPTVALLRAGRALLDSEDPTALAGMAEDPSLDQMLATDLVERRDEQVLDAIDAAIAGGSRVVLPWTFARLPAIHDGLRARGFTAEADIPRVVMGWEKLAP